MTQVLYGGDLKWQPWETFVGEAEVLPIANPPCATCQFWKPIRIFRASGEFDGVRCCHGDMCNDFSCWRDREVKP